MHHVYQLLDATGDVVYVGKSKSPKARFWNHIKRRPQPNKPWDGKFYGRTDLALQVVASFETEEEALLEEGRIKTLQGMAWTEKTGRNKRLLTFEQAEEIREKYEKGGHTHRGLAKEYNVSKGTISCIIRKIYYNYA